MRDNLLTCLYKRHKYPNLQTIKMKCVFSYFFLLLYTLKECGAITSVHEVLVLVLVNEELVAKDVQQDAV